jgi:hypothetical protein
MIGSDESELIDNNVDPYYIVCDREGCANSDGEVEVI